MKYLVNLTYDGSAFYGFQRQNSKITVQGEIEKVLSKIFNKDIKIIGASRTDRGVHANNAYAHFEIDKEVDVQKLKHSINKLIHDSIYVNNLIKVNDEFSARYNVKMKEYIYKINTGVYNPIEKDYVLQYNKKIDIKKLKKAIKKIKGTHDFKSFTSDTEKENYVRRIESITLRQNGSYIFIKIKAKSFLRYMIRNIVGLLLEINENKKRIEDIDKIFASLDRNELGITAPSCGLYLNKIWYN